MTNLINPSFPHPPINTCHHETADIVNTGRQTANEEGRVAAGWSQIGVGSRFEQHSYIFSWFL